MFFSIESILSHLFHPRFILSYVVCVGSALGRAAGGGVDDVQVFKAEEAEKGQRRGRAVEWGRENACRAAASTPRSPPRRPPSSPAQPGRPNGARWAARAAIGGRGAASVFRAHARAAPAASRRRLPPRFPPITPPSIDRRPPRPSPAHLDTDDAAALAAAHALPPHDASVPMREPSLAAGGRGSPM